jgi:hypothetical protein
MAVKNKYGVNMKDITIIANPAKAGDAKPRV